MYLLDTNIVSELSPENRAPDADLVAWLRRNGGQCYLSAVTLTEISYGVVRLRRRGATAKARRLATWLDEVVSVRGEHILPVDIDAALRTGALPAIARAAGAAPDIEDAWIAASAELHGMTVLTFDDADFRPMGVAGEQPWRGVTARVTARPAAARVPPQRGNQMTEAHSSYTLSAILR